VGLFGKDSPEFVAARQAVEQTLGRRANRSEVNEYMSSPYYAEVLEQRQALDRIVREAMSRQQASASAPQAPSQEHDLNEWCARNNKRAVRLAHMGTFLFARSLTSEEMDRCNERVAQLAPLMDDDPGPMERQRIDDAFSEFEAATVAQLQAMGLYATWASQWDDDSRG
jgi:hypothetical protein